jgi:hypothetical protein
MPVGTKGFDNEIRGHSTMSEATKEKLYWCSGLSLKEYFGIETPQTITEVLNAMEEKLVV